MIYKDISDAGQGAKLINQEIFGCLFFLKIRKEYGIKDDKDWFDGRHGIKIYKRY